MYDIRLAKVKLKALRKALEDLERMMRSSDLEDLSTRATAIAILTCKKTDIEREIAELAFNVSLHNG